MAGFGVAPAGTSPFGTGTPPSAVEPPQGPAGSRYINPTTRDYEVDPTTRQFAQMPPTRQRVLLAITTKRNSSGLRDFGKRSPVRMGDSFEAEESALVREALRPMVEVEKSVRINAIVVERGAGGRARTTISFTDLVTGDQDRVRV